MRGSRTRVDEARTARGMREERALRLSRSAMQQRLRPRHRWLRLRALAVASVAVVAAVASVRERPWTAWHVSRPIVKAAERLLQLLGPLRCALLRV